MVLADFVFLDVRIREPCRMYPYRIRLRGPWEYEIAEREAKSHPTLPRAGRIVMPCRLNEGGLGGFSGKIRLRRRFGLPRGLTPHEQVWLTIAEVAGSISVQLNSTGLGACDDRSAFEAKITQLLRDRNELDIELQARSEADGLVGEAALEIRCAAYLRDLKAERIPGGVIRVRGQLIGESPESLDLYVLCKGRNIGYRKLLPFVGHEEFEIVTDDATSIEKDAILRVELIQGSVVWYAADVAVG